MDKLSTTVKYNLNNHIEHSRFNLIQQLVWKGEFNSPVTVELSTQD